MSSQKFRLTRSLSVLPKSPPLNIRLHPDLRWRWDQTKDSCSIASSQKDTNVSVTYHVAIRGVFKCRTEGLVAPRLIRSDDRTTPIPSDLATFAHARSLVTCVRALKNRLDRY